MLVVLLVMMGFEWYEGFVKGKNWVAYMFGNYGVFMMYVPLAVLANYWLYARWEFRGVGGE